MGIHFSRRPRAGWVLPVLAAAAMACSVFTGSLGNPTPTGFVPPPPTTAGPSVEPGASPTTPATGASETPPAGPSATPLLTDASPTAPPAGPSATPLPSDIPEVIAILQPGSNASISSPVHVAGEADPTFEQNLVIQITDQDGNVLVTQPTTIQVEAGQRGPYEADVAFAVAADQPGRVSVYSTSARDGGLIHLNSVEVTLLASGPAAASGAVAPKPEGLIITSPELNEAIAGGVIRVEGITDAVFENQLAVILCGEGGSGGPEPVCGTDDNVLEIGVATVNPPDVGQPGPYLGDLPYGISAPVQARLVVYSRSPRDGGILHLATVPLQLSP